MPRTLRTPVVAALLVALAATAVAAKKDNPANKDTVERRLLNHFPLTGYDGMRGRPTSPGIVVELQRPGLEALPASAISPAFSYKGGALRKLAATGLLSNLVPLPPGTRMFITKIEARENHVLVDVLTAEPFDGVFFKAAVHFDFGKGYLDNPDFTRIELTVAELFAPERGGNNAPNQQQQQQQMPPPQQQQPQRQQQVPISEPPPPPPPPAEPPPPPPPPPTASATDLKVGMTGDQVRAAMGKPSQIVKLGPKEILVYSGIKVTLVNGKVTSID